MPHRPPCLPKSTPRCRTRCAALRERTTRWCAALSVCAEPCSGKARHGVRRHDRRDRYCRHLHLAAAPVPSCCFLRAAARFAAADRKSTRLNSSHSCATRLPSSACKKKSPDSQFKSQQQHAVLQFLIHVSHSHLTYNHLTSADDKST